MRSYEELGGGEEIIRIAQVVRGIHPYGGVSGVALNLTKGFRDLGVVVDEIFLTKSPTESKNKYISRLRYIIEVLIFTVLGTIQIALYRRRHPGAVIIVHGDALGGDIFVDHGLHKALVRANVRMIFRNPFHLFLLAREEIRHRLKLYKKIVALSEFSKDNILKNYPSVKEEDIQVIPNGVDLEKFFPPADLPSKETLRLIFVGHEFERKGLYVLLEAVSLVKDSVPIQLTVIGGSQAEIGVASKICNEKGLVELVELLGRRRDVDVLMRRSHYLLLPSIYESWALVVFEAMASGLGVMATPVGGASQVIRDGENGRVLVRDPQMMAEALRWAYSNLHEFENISRHAHATATNYAWKQIALNYLELASGHEAI